MAVGYSVAVIGWPIGAAGLTRIGKTSTAMTRPTPKMPAAHQKAVV